MLIDYLFWQFINVFRVNDDETLVEVTHMQEKSAKSLINMRVAIMQVSKMYK